MVETDAIAAALAQFTDGDLQRVRAAGEDSSPDLAPDLLAYLDHAADWEQHRRRGVDFPLQPPANALGDDERGPGLMALAVIAGEFRTSGDDAVVALFDAIASAVMRDMPDTLH